MKKGRILPTMRYSIHKWILQVRKKKDKFACFLVFMKRRRSASEGGTNDDDEKSTNKRQTLCTPHVRRVQPSIISFLTPGPAALPSFPVGIPDSFRFLSCNYVTGSGTPCPRKI